MKIKTILVALSVLILFYQADVKVSMQKKEECLPNRNVSVDERPRFALLVGIKNYKNYGVNPPVVSAEKDVALMKEVLVKNYGFTDDEKHIKTILTAQATRGEILKGFEFLIANAKEHKDKKPIIVFYFSGHGTQYPNQDFDKEDSDFRDGFDEALVPFDSQEAGVYDILDDEIDDVSGELAKWSSDILYIFDSCHSGTASRGDSARETKPNPRNGERTPYKRKFKPSDVERERNKKIVTLAAAMPNEKARQKNDLSNGLMTFHLAAALRRASRTTTYQELMREVRTAVSSENNEQHPFPDGDELRPVLGEGSNRADASIEILTEPTDGKIKFAAGKLYGVQPGTQVAIYDACATKYVGETGFLTYANVLEVGDREAIAVLPDEKANPKVKSVTKNSKLVLTAPTFGGNPVALVIDDKTVAKGLEAEIGKVLGSPNSVFVTNQMLEIVSHADLQNRSSDKQPSAILRLRRGKFSEVFPDLSRVALPKFCTGKSLFPTMEREVYYVENSLNEAEAKPAPVFGRFFEDEKDLSKLAQIIVQNIGLYARQRNVKNIENVNSALNDRVSLELKPTPIVAVPSCNIADKETVDKKKDVCQCPAGKMPELKDNKIMQNAVFEIELQNISSPTQQGKLYVGVLLVSNDGKIALVNKDNLTDELTATKPFNFMFHATQPAGMEMIKVIITSKPEDLEGLKGLEILDYTPRSGTKTPLEQILGQSGMKSRGNPNLSPASPDSWGVKTIEWTITDTILNCECKPVSNK